MPQFEPANFLPQMVWLVLAFAILYFGIVRATLPRLGRVIDARETQVKSDLDTAESVKAEADRVRARYEAGIAAAQDAARAKLAEANAAASRAIEAKLAESNAALEADAQSAEAELEAARAKAMTEIEAMAGDAAAEIVEKLTGVRPGAAEAASAARAALA